MSLQSASAYPLASRLTYPPQRARSPQAALAALPYRNHSAFGVRDLATAPSLFWTKIPLYLLLGMGAVFTLVLAVSLITDPGCASSPTTSHVLDGFAYAGLAATLGVIGVVSMNALARFVRARVRSKSWLTTVGAGLLTLLPVLLAVGGDVALGLYVYFQDLFLECLVLFPPMH